MEIKYSRGTHKYDNQPTQHIAKDFDVFEREILSTRSDIKGIGYFAGAFSEGQHTNRVKYPELSTYRQSHLECERGFLPFDFDKFVNIEQLEKVLLFFKSYRCFIYTTHSHRDEDPRLRVVVSLSREINTAEGRILGGIFNEMLISSIGAGFTLDKCVFRNGQPIYLPPTYARVETFNGPPLGIDGFLSTDYGVPSAGGHKASFLSFETPRQKAYLEQALSHISADCDYELYRRVIWGILSSEWGCAEDVAYNWSNTCPKRFEEGTFYNLVNSFDSSREFRPTLNTVYRIAQQNGWNDFQQ